MRPWLDADDDLLIAVADVVEQRAGGATEEHVVRVRPDAVSTPYLWWSRPDVGLLEWLGRPVRVPREPTLLNLVAMR